MRTPLLTLAALCLCTGGVHAQALVEVAQESSPNAGDFDAHVLGTIDPYDTALSASDYYQWDLNGKASFNGPAPTLASNTSQILFLDGADGLSVVLLHDAVVANGGNDGEAGTRIVVMGDPDGLTRTVEDDPNGESPNDQYTGNAGDSEFTAQQRWFSCCADGYALTGLDGDWTLLAEFSDVDDDLATKNHRNLFIWQARSGDGSMIPLNLTSDRRVRFRLLETTAPCGTGDCFADNGTTGCEDEACCLTVCGIDAFCCDSVWDSACAELAIANCEGAPNPNEACCFDNGICQDLLPLACSIAGGIAQGPGTVCETTECPVPDACPGEGDCFVDNGTPGCDDAACCQTVCGLDDFCCNTEWDATCAEEAAEFCTEVPDACPGVGDCFGLDNGTPGCSDESCCSTICALDAFCCTVEWDGNCVDLALEECDNVPVGSCPGDGDCFTENGTPGCADVACCSVVCAADNFCCVVLWDDACVEDADILCDAPTEACCLLDESCIETQPNLCALAGGTAQGPDSTCDSSNCSSTMQACCLTEETCVVALVVACQAAGGTLLGPGSVCSVDGCIVPNTDEACCIPGAGCVEVDPSLCVVASGVPQGPETTCDTTNCGPVCPGDGDCLADNGSVGCENAACCTVVCTSDSFCCDTTWDDLCAETAFTLCATVLPRACCLPDGGCQDLMLADCILAGGSEQPVGSSCDVDGCEPPCVGDVNNDGAVNIDDLVLVILDFGLVGPGLATDVNGDFVVSIDDVVDLIVAFGPCNEPS